VTAPKPVPPAIRSMKLAGDAQSGVVTRMWDDDDDDD
jgi:hypothetical protein